MVTEIADLRASLEAARTALAQARWDAALLHLSGCEDWPIELAEAAVLVKADVLTRRDPAGALGWLAATQDLVAGAAGRFGRELATGRAYANVRNFESAAAHFERARTLLVEVPGGAPKLAYQTARLRWFRREAQPDDADVVLALTDPDPSGRAAAYAIRAWTYASRGDYAEQIADLSTALDIAAESDYRCDVGTMGIIVHTLARIAFETADLSGITAARRAYEAIAWTDNVRVDRFSTLRALGMDAFMRGEIARAQWLFRDASGVAPTTAWRAAAHVDRAYAARIGGNEAWCLDELTEAVRIMQGVSWGSTFGEERLVLVDAAQLLSPTDPGEARRLAAMYSMLGTESVSPMLALAQDRRAAGFERYTLGKIEQTLGNKERALVLLQDAYQIFAPSHHEYRGMLAASALAELTGDTVWAERACAHIASYPGCPLAKTTVASATHADAVLEALTPLQRQLARAHWSGVDLDGLSRRFSRSLYTIERQVAEIYRAFGVESGVGLRDEAMRRGIA